MKLMVRRPAWRHMFEVGVRREVRWDWDDRVAVQWSLMLGFVEIVVRVPVRRSPDSGREADQ